MRAAERSSDPIAAGDFTARARIRDAAVSCFAREGFGVGLRTIAADAGVTAGLVTHHFGSKAGLRHECDEYVFRSVRESKADVVGSDGPAQLLLRLASVEAFAPLLGYVLRSLQAGGGLARSLVDHLVADAQAYIAEGVAAGTIRASRDEAARARYLVVQGLGAILLDLTLDPGTGSDGFVAAVHAQLARTAIPGLELFTEGFFTDARLLETYLAHAPAPAPPP